MKRISYLVSSIFFVCLLACVGVDPHMKTIKNNVAKDCESKYYMVKENGDPIECYVHAGLVAQAYLQAGDKANYQNWKTIENNEAIRAGVK